MSFALLNQLKYRSMICALLLLSGCASAPKLLPNEKLTTPTQTSSKADISHLDPEQRSQLYYSILLANLAEKKQLFDIAQNNYQDALDKTKSSALASNSTRIALLQKNYPVAEKALEVWQQNAPLSTGPKKIGLLIALHQNQTEKAYQLLGTIITKLKTEARHIDDPEKPLTPSELDNQFKQLLQLAYYKTPDTLEFEKQVSSFGELLNRFNQEQTVTNDVWAITMAAEAFIQLKSRSPLSKLNRIHQLLDKSLSLRPDFIGAIETKAQALALISEEKSAEFLTEILQHQALSKTQVSNLANVVYKQNNFRTAVIGFRRILDAEPDNQQVKFLLAGSLYGNKEYQAASDLFWQLSLDDFRKPASSFYCADAAERIKDEVRSLSCYEMVPVGKYFMQARHRIAEIFANKAMYAEGAKSLQKAQTLVDFNQRQQLLKYEVNYLLENEQFALARQRLDSAIQLEPHNGTIYYLQLLLADKTLPESNFLQKVQQLQAQAPDTELRKQVTYGALELLTKRKKHLLIYQLLDREVSLYPKDPELLYSRALANQPLKRFDWLERDLRQLLNFDPDNIDAKNALGYTLADQNRNLDEALILIEQAYQAKPDNDAILDSMGWVHYRLGNLQKALNFITLSYQKAPVPEIAAHLGEILWQLGEQEKARQVWQKALQQEPQNQYILDTLARFPEADLTP